MGRGYVFYRLFYVAISSVLLFPLIKYTHRIDQGMIFVYAIPWLIIRHIVMFGSLVLFVWAFFFCYDSLSFFGIRQILSYRKAANSNPLGAIRRKGLLSIVRHPMYLALILFLWSTVFTAMDVFIDSILTVYVIIGTKLEEKKLVLEFGQEYVKYQHEVPMLIPFLRPKAP
jgi:methanethiol S-methyltransferase